MLRLLSLGDIIVTEVQQKNYFCAFVSLDTGAGDGFVSSPPPKLESQFPPNYKHYKAKNWYTCIFLTRNTINRVSEM